MGKYTYGTNLSVTPTRTVISNIPTQNGTLEYTGSELTCSFNNYDSSQLDVSGDTGTNAGSYTATFTPKNGYCWPDNSTESKTVTWTITEQSITTVPSQSNTLTYDTTEQSVQWSNFDSNKLDISGTQSATNAGSYEVTFTPKTNYKWSDDSANKTVTWTIGKTQGSFTLSETEITLDADNTSATVTISVVGDGTISISNSDNTVASAVLTNDQRSITISSPSEENGEAVITVSLSGTDNYLSAENQSITVTCDFVVVSSWTTATDAEIVAMVQAADNGEIDLSKYWAVGDERVVTLLQQDNLKDSKGYDLSLPYVTFIISHKGLYTDTNGKEVNFIVTTNEKCGTCDLNNKTTEYANSDIRNWCNNTFYNLIPETLRAIFKQFNCYTSKSFSEVSTYVLTQDYFEIPTEIEFVGEKSNWSSSIDIDKNKYTQFDIFKTQRSASHTNFVATTRSYSSKGWTGEYFVWAYSNGTESNTQGSRQGTLIFGCI